MVCCNTTFPLSARFRRLFGLGPDSRWSRRNTVSAAHMLEQRARSKAASRAASRASSKSRISARFPHSRSGTNTAEPSPEALELGEADLVVAVGEVGPGEDKFQEGETLSFRPRSQRAVVVARGEDGCGSTNASTSAVGGGSSICVSRMESVASRMASAVPENHRPGPARMDLIGDKWVEEFGKAVDLPACSNGCMVIKYGDGAQVRTDGVEERS